MLERKIARAFAMDDATWLRHANPWRVVLRKTVLTLLILAFWSRLWLRLVGKRPGCSRHPVDMVQSPYIFPPPTLLDNWASKAVLGERVCLNRDTVPVPVHHQIVPNILSAVSGIGMLFVFCGILAFDFRPTVFGMGLVSCGKLWFLDRMTWLCEDMRDAKEEFKG